jgi:hypothetical protein
VAIAALVHGRRTRRRFHRSIDERWRESGDSTASGALGALSATRAGLHATASV